MHTVSIPDALKLKVLKQQDSNSWVNRVDDELQEIFQHDSKRHVLNTTWMTHRGNKPKRRFICPNPSPKISLPIHGMEAQRGKQARFKPSKTITLSTNYVMVTSVINSDSGVEKLPPSYNNCWSTLTFLPPQTLTAKIITGLKFYKVPQNSLTMAPNQSKPIQPSKEFFKVKDALVLKKVTVEYCPPARGLGIELRRGEITDVWMNEVGSKVTINDTKNDYAVKFISLTAEALRHQKDNKGNKKCNTTGEVEAILEVANKEVTDMCEKGGYEVETFSGKSSRYLKCYTAIVNDYRATDDNAGSVRNKTMDMHLLKFIKMRYGMIPYFGNEWDAAIKLFTEDYVNRNKDVKKDTSSGSWSLPLICFLNGHLLSNKLTGISFSEDGDEDDLAQEQRKTNSKEVWKTVNDKKVPIMIESRENVITEYDNWVKKIFPDEPQLVLHVDEGPPEEPEPEGQPPSAKKRRVLKDNVDSRL